MRDRKVGVWALAGTELYADQAMQLRPRDANKKALRQVERATNSDPVKGKDLLESAELKRQLSKAEERYRSGLSPKKAKSKSR
jgi:hypothetical protein